VKRPIGKRFRSERLAAAPPRFARCRSVLRSRTAVGQAFQPDQDPPQRSAHRWPVSAHRSAVPKTHICLAGGSGCDDEDRLVSWTRDDNNLSQIWTLTSEGDWSQFVENTTTENMQAPIIVVGLTSIGGSLFGGNVGAGMAAACSENPKIEPTTKDGGGRDGAERGQR